MEYLQKNAPDPDVGHVTKSSESRDLQYFYLGRKLP